MVLTKTGTILIITDNLQLQKEINEYLITEGFKTDSAFNPEKACSENLKEKNIDLILIDDKVISNGKFIINLKKENHRLPIIVMITSHKDSPVIVDLFDNGTIENCILKPFLSQSLISLIINMLTVNYFKKSEKTETTERRKITRKASQFDVYYSFIDKSKTPPLLVEKSGKSINVSIGGMCLESEDTDDISKYFDMKVLLSPEKSIWLTGEVLWQKEKADNNKKSVGVRFVDYNIKEIELIHDYFL